MMYIELIDLICMHYTWKLPSLDLHRRIVLLEPLFVGAHMMPTRYSVTLGVCANACVAPSIQSYNCYNIADQPWIYNNMLSLLEEMPHTTIVSSVVCQFVSLSVWQDYDHARVPANYFLPVAGRCARARRQAHRMAPRAL